MQQYDEVALSYERWIAPRYRAIADGLAGACPLQPGEAAFEVAAGTGVLSRAQAAGGGVADLSVLTDLSIGMLKVARELLISSAARYVVSDCGRLPLRSGSMDVALSSLGPLQDRMFSVREIHRVLRLGGRLGIAMWGPRYSEVRLHNRVRQQVGLRPFPPADAAGAVRRLVRGGFVDVERKDVRLDVHHENIEQYIIYRRSFGRPKSWSDDTYARYFECLRGELRRRYGDGPVSLDWKITYLTAKAGPADSHRTRSETGSKPSSEGP